MIALFLVFATQASAQVKFGVTGGMNFNTANFENIDVKASAGWNAGVTMLLDLPLGLSLQPSIVYSQKNVSLVDGISNKIGAVEIPVSVQWGPDLILLRPFVDVTPYVGYALSHDTTLDTAWGDLSSSFQEDSFDKFQYGLGVGAGVNIWKLQAIVRYVWNFGALTSDNFNWDKIVEGVTGDFMGEGKSENFGGITFGVSFLF